MFQGNSGSYIWSNTELRWVLTDRTPKGHGDVYFDKPGIIANIADEKNPNGYFISSKSEKSRIMKKLGMREAGDKVHGSRDLTHKFQQKL